MNIAFDAREYKKNSAGKGRYVKELLAALAKIDTKHQYFLLGSNGDMPIIGKNFHWVVVQGSFGLYFGLRRILAQNKIDILFSPTSFLTPLFTNVKTILVVHDLAVFVEPRAAPSFKTKIIEKLSLGWALKKSSRIIAVSQTTKKDLIRYFGTLMSKIAVVPNAPFESKLSPKNCSVTLKKYRLPARYILFVGTLEPRKNIFNLLLAYSRLSPAIRARYPLVLAGPKGWNMADLDKNINRYNLENNVLQTGFVEDSELACLYKNAAVFVYPSWYEGFGLPVLEAFRHSVPVITSTAPALLEVSRRCAWHVKPGDYVALSQALEKVLTDGNIRSDLITRGEKRSKNFSWEKTARAVVDIIESVK